MTVKVSGHFDLVFRKDRLTQKGIDIKLLCATLEAESPLDQDDALLSFGPHFGGEVAATMIGRCEKLGLVYGDDFYDVDMVTPAWFKLRVEFDNQ